jgi:hypothetical protein
MGRRPLVSSGSIQDQGTGSCEEDFGVQKMRFRDYQLLTKDSVPWSQPVCYDGWVGFLTARDNGAKTTSGGHAGYYITV